jgi:hypothetical protein
MDGQQSESRSSHQHTADTDSTSLSKHGGLSGAACRQ